MLIETISNDPFDEGYDACNAGKGLEECYYVPFSEGEYEWLDGWRSAHSTKVLEDTKPSDTLVDVVYENDNDFYLHHGWIMESERKGIYQGRKVTLDSPTVV